MYYTIKKIYFVLVNLFPLINSEPLYPNIVSKLQKKN